MKSISRQTRFAAILFFLVTSPIASIAINCKVTPAHEPTEAELAALGGNNSKAESLFRQELAQHPKDPVLTAALVRTLLDEGKVADAVTTVNDALAVPTKSVELLTAKAEVQYRQGTPWDESSTLMEAQKADPCYPRMHLETARWDWLNSNHATALREIRIAYQLDPNDLDIRNTWIHTLPRKARIAELKKYLEQFPHLDPELLERMQHEVAILDDREQNRQSSCHLASTITATEIPLASLLMDAKHLRGWGLEVAFNGKKAQLEIDTGAGGLYVSRSIAERAGLKPITRSQAHGIGDRGPQSGYTAYADSIKIGSLEFKDCLVEVSDRRNVADINGLIGMNVFSNFLVTLDFPWHKLSLAPLPPYPDSAATTATLDTEQESQQEPDHIQGNKDATDNPTPKPNTPHDRYIAPSMKDYTHVYRIGHNMLVPVSLNQKAIHLFIVDTGAFRTSISPEAGREVTKVHTNSDIQVRGISGPVDKVYSGDRVMVRVANLSQEVDDIISFDNARVNKALGMEVSGFLGFDFLHFLTLSIDYRDGLMKFDYAENRGYQHIR